MAIVDGADAPRETIFRHVLLISSTALILSLGALFLANPDIDLAISNAAREACPVPAPSPGRAWCPTAAITSARLVFMAIFLLVIVATLLASVSVLVAERKWFGLAQARCGFMIAVLLVGPGFVANLIIKDNLGRARPRDVIEFGGTKTFSPPLVPSQECRRNCSFVSGEASSMFASFFGLALLFPKFRLSLLLLGVGTGLLAGAIRIMQGAHFLSDVLFAGLFMAMTAAVLHFAIIDIWRDPQRVRNAFASHFPTLARLAAGRIR